jgi:hypothetical protein
VRVPGVSEEEVAPLVGPTLRERVKGELARKLDGIKRSQASTVTQAHLVDISLWLEITHWPQYLEGQDLVSLAPLVDLPPWTEVPNINSHDIIL